MHACLRTLLMLALLGAPAWADVAEFTVAEEARYQTLINQLRCLVCQNQTIAESNAPLAQDLRRQVQEKMRAGRSDDEIKDYLTERYGDFVLYDPPMKKTTWLLWLGPFILLAGALMIALLILRKSKKVDPEPEIKPVDISRILKDQDS